jgi:GTPase SAR1 family protein
MTKKIFFIGGASGSGKTAVIPALKEELSSNFLIYDFDDIGIPENANTSWRQEATEKWLQKIISDQKDVCLLGQMVLGEIMACPTAAKLEKINYCLLDVYDFERIQRIESRGSKGEATQGMLNWASWLRMHTKDLQWTQSVIKESSWQNMNFSVWDGMHQWPAKVNTYILDTTKQTILQTAQLLSKWIKGGIPK